MPRGTLLYASVVLTLVLTSTGSAIVLGANGIQTRQVSDTSAIVDGI